MPAPPASYLIVRVAGAVTNVASPRSQTTQSTLYVVDPAAPGVAAQTIDLGSADTFTGSAPNAATVPAYTVDRAARRYTYDGEAVAVFAKDGKVWKIELRSDLSHVPTQVSSLTNVCGLAFNLEPLRISTDGRDAWVKVETASSSGSCASGRGISYVRTTMSSTTAPLPDLPGIVVDTLDDGALGTLGFLMSTPTGINFYAPDFSLVGAAGGLTAGAHTAQLMGYDYTTLQASYYRVDGTVRRLAWSAAGATFAPSIHTFASADFGQRNPTDHADLDALYFADNNELYKVSGSGNPVLIATVPGLPIYAIFPSETHLALWQADPAHASLPYSASVIAKTGGALTATVANATAFGATATKMIYTSGGNTHAVNFDGSGDAVLGPTSTLSSNVYARSRVADVYHIDNFVACVPGVASDTKCSNGQIVQTEVNTLAKTTIGTVAHAATYSTGSFGFGDRTFGLQLPAVSSVPTFTGYSVTFPVEAGGVTRSSTDLYTWTPGVAGSLVRLTNPIP